VDDRTPDGATQPRGGFADARQGDGRAAAGGDPVPPSPEGPVSTLVCRSCGKRNRIRPSPRGVPACGACHATLPWIVSAGDATFDAEANAAVAVLVDLWAPWCGPCRVVSPIVEELARDHAGRLKVVKVNVDDNPALARRFSAFSIPTLVVLSGGRVVDRLVGAVPKSQLAILLAPYLVRRA